MLPASRLFLLFREGRDGGERADRKATDIKAFISLRRRDP